MKTKNACILRLRQKNAAVEPRHILPTQKHAALYLRRPFTSTTYNLKTE